MKIRRILSLCLVLVFLLCGCGVGSENAGFEREDSLTAGENPGLAADSAVGSSQAPLPTNQKIIRKVWMDAETEDMTALLAEVEVRISALGGYVEAREIQNGSAYSGRRYRYADITIRIPAESIYSFVDDVSAVSNITSTRETSDDVTLSYVENESKVTALETEQTRLLELLSKAGTMEDILKIESRLTEIRSQLENVKSQLRVYDNLVSYGTVYLNITEVTTYTVVEEPDTLWERMGRSISESWEDMVDGLENLLVFLFAALPHLLPLSVLAAAIVIPITVHKRKKAKKLLKKPEEPAE